LVIGHWSLVLSTFVSSWLIDLSAPPAPPREFRIVRATARPKPDPARQVSKSFLRLPPPASADTLESMTLASDREVVAPRVIVADVWNRYTMALDDLADRMQRITSALNSSGVSYALVGGQAVALWVATKDPAAVRTTKDVDVLLSRADLPQARVAARTVDMDYFETMGVGMFLDRRDPNPRHAVHIVWAGELVRAGDTVAAPNIDDQTTLPGDHHVVSLPKLVEMKLTANREQDRLHLRDLIDVGLIARTMLAALPNELASKLAALLGEQGRYPAIR
jgi:hypothetical protein